MRHITALLAATALTAFANSDPGTDINTPMGRIVWGHPLKPKHATDNNNVKKFRDDGTPVMEVSYGLAIPTAEFQATLWPAMFQEMSKGYPNGAPGNFSWKITQEHEIDKQGKPYGQREGYAGCVVLAISTLLDPPSAMVYEAGAYRQIGADDIKCGDWGMAGINFKVNVPNNRAHTPSLYVNPRLFVKCYDGDAISSGSFDADPTQVFGAAPVIPPPPPGARPIGAPSPGGMPPAGTMPGNGYAPAGPATSQPMMGNAGTAAPVANGMTMPGAQTPGGMPGMQQPQGTPGAGMAAQPGAGYAPPAQPGSMPPPATDFIPGAPQQPGGYAMPGQAGMPGMPQR